MGMAHKGSIGIVLPIRAKSPETPEERGRIVLADKQGMLSIFSDNIITIIHRNRISHTELAEKVGVTFMTVNLWINQVHLPRSETLYKLSKLYKIPMEHWLTKLIYTQEEE